MENIDKIVVAILLGALFIGTCIYVAITNTLGVEKVGLQKTSLPAVEKATDSTLTSTCQASENVAVTKVIDGDTVIVEGGEHVRLLGIDADEKGVACYNVAKTRLEELVLGKQVRLEKDTTDIDIYGRCLRTVFLQDQNIDVQMVREGLAVARFYPPDVIYKTQIADAEHQAITNKTGCKWSK